MSSESKRETDTRTRILQAAHQLMEQRDGRGVRMRDVAERAGVSRQAVYDHFGSRVNLVLATTHYVDEIRGLAERKAQFDHAISGVEKLDAYVDFWGNYILEIYGLAQALMADRHDDPAAEAAWNDRMSAVRTSCRIIVDALARDGALAPGWTVEEATDMLWTILSIRSWEDLTIDCGWSQEAYISRIKQLAKSLLVSQPHSGT